MSFASFTYGPQIGAIQAWSMQACLQACAFAVRRVPRHTLSSPRHTPLGEGRGGSGTRLITAHALHRGNLDNCVLKEFACLCRRRRRWVVMGVTKVSRPRATRRSAANVWSVYATFHTKFSCACAAAHEKDDILSCLGDI